METPTFPLRFLSDGERVMLIRLLTYGDCDDEVLGRMKACYAASANGGRVPCDAAVALLWKAGMKIEAIKLHRSKNLGRGLKECKDDCEAIV